MKSVCIVGAGPAGLVAAKAFLDASPGQFLVMILEKSDRIGGIWSFADEEVPGNAYLGRWTPTNLSRFSVGFADLAWTFLDKEKGAEELAMFPAACNVQAYLDQYKDKYLPGCIFLYGCTVTWTKRVMNRGNVEWQVSYKEAATGEQVVDAFDYVINAAGFFSSPKPLQPALPIDSTVKAVHTSAFRTLDNLFHRPEGEIKGKKILLFGGGNSAGETAANIAFQLSDARHKPAGYDFKYEDVKIYHVTPRPFYAIPPFVPDNAQACTFVPLDLKFYDLSKRPPGPITSASGRLPPQVKELLHGAIQGMIGDQADLGAAALTSTPGDSRGAAYVALSETYPEYVRSGDIVPIAGRVEAFAQDPTGALRATIRNNEHEPIELDDIAAVVYATGYTPSSALQWLPKDVLKALSYDATSARLPLILQQYQTYNPAVPDLAFIGFYEGPYWGVMEMQARLIVERWTTGKTIPERPYESVDQLRGLRKSMKKGAKDVPQYWFGDYLGYVEEIARGLGLRRNDFPFKDERDGVVTPARYLTPTSSIIEADATMTDLEATLQACKQGRYRARAVFRALQGVWNVTRRTTTRDANQPEFQAAGAAVFCPREPTHSNAEEHTDGEYLYREMNTTQKCWLPADNDEAIRSGNFAHVVRYTEATDTISIWFTNNEHVTDVRSHRHDLRFSESNEDGVCVAYSDYMVEDSGEMIYYEYRFEFKAVSLVAWELNSHEINGLRCSMVSRFER